MPPDPPAPAAPATPAPATPSAPTEAGFRVEPEFVKGSVNRTHSQKIAAAMQAAIAEVGEVSPEQRAREMAGEQPNLRAKEEPAEEEPEALPEKPAKAKAKAKEEPKPEPEAPAAPAEPPVGVHELVHERRKLRANFDQRMRQVEQERASERQALQSHVDRLQPFMEAAEAYEAGDFDGFAAALGKAKGNGEVKDWNTLVDEATKAAGLPMYREVRKLKAEQRARAEAEKRQREQWQQQQAQQQRAAQEQQWVAGIGSELTADEDPAVAELLDVDPAFSQHVFGHQRSANSQTGEIPSSRAAAEQVFETLWKNVSRWVAFAKKHEASPFIQKITGARPAPPKKGEKSTASSDGESGTADRNGVRPRAAKPPPAVSQNRTAEASAMGRLSRRDAIRSFADRMNAAALNESPGNAND